MRLKKRANGPPQWDCDRRRPQAERLSQEAEGRVRDWWKLDKLNVFKWNTEGWHICWETYVDVVCLFLLPGGRRRLSGECVFVCGENTHAHTQWTDDSVCSVHTCEALVASETMAAGSEVMKDYANMKYKNTLQICNTHTKWHLKKYIFYYNKNESWCGAQKEVSFDHICDLIFVIVFSSKWDHTENVLKSITDPITYCYWFFWYLY